MGGLALVVLLIGCMLNRQERKHGNKTGCYRSAMPENARQALCILLNQDDGRRHYAQLSPA